nr:RNA-dependent RNA polymerase [Molussus totiviridae 1]
MNGDSWAVVRAWLSNRIPSHACFEFNGDELDLISPATTSAQHALVALSARSLTSSTWQWWVERIMPVKKTIFDSNWVTGRYMPKPDDKLDLAGIATPA